MNTLSAHSSTRSTTPAPSSRVRPTIFVRFEDFGWCKGTLLKRNTDRRRTIKGVMVNFIAKFDIDEDTTAVKLEAKDYDTAAFADYESWLLLEPEAEAAAEADA